MTHLCNLHDICALLIAHTDDLENFQFTAGQNELLLPGNKDIACAAELIRLGAFWSTIDECWMLLC